MAIELIDTHAHLDEEAFRNDSGEVIQRAMDAGVVAMITIGTTAQSSQLAVELAAKHTPVYAAVGIQPNYVAEARPGDWEVIEQLSHKPKVVAIGETGLDRYWDHAPFELQQEYFTRHIELARQRDLPFVVHCREAEEDVVNHMTAAAGSGKLRGVMHSFTGGLKTAESCIELGLFISFAGMLTYKKNDELRNVASQVPADRLLIETDSPYLAPVPKRGKRNEPALVQHTAACLAETRGQSAEEIAALTTANARALFGV